MQTNGKTSFRISYYAIVTTILIVFAGLSSCTVVKVRNASAHKQTKEQTLPPGQVKKITGSKSAAPYAPGHNK